MSQRQRSAREVAKPRGGGYWIDHAAVVEEDIAWLRDATELTLWNVSLPPNLFSQLPNLVWLDVRGGSSEALEVGDARSLRFFSANQVRGLADASAVASLTQLRYLRLYGLAKLRRLPSLQPLEALARVEIGQMQALESLSSVLDAPMLKELLLLRKVAVGPTDIRRIQDHPTLEMFGWSIEDVPARLWEPVLSQVKLPKPRFMHPEEWFSLQRGLGAPT